MYQRFFTTDNFHVEVYCYNPYGYNCHVFIANSANEYVNSGNSTVYHMRGKDAYEALMSDGKHMVKGDIIRMFF